MGRDRKGFCRQRDKKGRCWEIRKANNNIMVSGLSGKPTYVDIPNDIVDLMKKMDPRQVADILIKK
jgi:hypothetical protein